MFNDLKEYQDITTIYNQSVNISEEQRAINKLFQEENFTLEELDYLEENFDTIWEEYFVPEILYELCEDEEHIDSLTEENLQEIAGLRTIGKLALKANRGMLKNIVKNKKAAAKAVSAGKTAIGDTFKGAKSLAGNVLKKVAPFAGKVAKTIGKGALLGTGALIPFSIANNLRKKGKAEREAMQKMKDAGQAAGLAAAKKVADADKGGKTAAEAGAEAIKKVTDAGKKGGEVGASSIKKTEMKDRGAQQQKKTEEKPKMSSIEKQNRKKFGDDRVDHLKNKQKDFKLYRSKKMTKDEFIKKYPNSITAQEAKGLRDHAEWDAYDMVLEYLYSTEQVDTIEEANYVMMEMDQETIGEIVNEVEYLLDERFGLDTIKAGFKKVGKVAGDVVQKGKDVVSGAKDKVVKRIERRKENVAINKKIEDKKSNMNDDNAGKTKAQIMALNRKKEKLNNPKEYERKQNMSGSDRAKELFKQRNANK